MKRVNLYIEEVLNEDVVFATWCVGVKTRRFIYAIPVSCSNITNGEHHIIKVPFTSCRKSEANGYSISVDAQKGARKDGRIKTIPEQTIDEEILKEIMAAKKAHNADK